MTMRLIACMLIGSVIGTEGARAEMAAARQIAAVQGAPVQTVPVQTQTAAPAATIDVPAGTKVPLNLVTQIMSKSTKPGDTVRAVVAFPVTVGNQLAIPAGTYVEGQLVSSGATKAAKKTRYGASAPGNSGLQIHFTRLVYANGYTVALDGQNVAGVNADAADVEEAQNDVASMPLAREHGPDGGAAFLEGQIGYPTPPPLPPLPQNPGPNPVAISLGVVGAFALLVLGGVLLAKHGNHATDAVLYDAGWQFSMSLASALTLDRAQVMDAARMGPATP